jgi:hypothetical protein
MRTRQPVVQPPHHKTQPRPNDPTSSDFGSAGRVPVPRYRAPAAITAFVDLYDSSDHRDDAERPEHIARADPMDPTDRTEPTEAIDKAEPIEPMERTDPLDPIDKKESSDHSDQRARGMLAFISSSCRGLELDEGASGREGFVTRGEGIGRGCGCRSMRRISARMGGDEDAAQ